MITVSLALIDSLSTANFEVLYFGSLIVDIVMFDAIRDMYVAKQNGKV